MTDQISIARSMILDAVQEIKIKELNKKEDAWNLIQNTDFKDDTDRVFAEKVFKDTWDERRLALVEFTNSMNRALLNLHKKIESNQNEI